MRSTNTLVVVGCHAEGEVGDVIVGGVPDLPGKTMYDKLLGFQQTQDHIRLLMMNEPRGRPSLNTNILMAPCDTRADMGLLIMANDQYAYMSGSNTMCATTVLLETGMVEMKEPETTVSLDTAAGLVTVKAQCEAGKCKSVSIENLGAFAAALDLEVEVPGFGVITVDVAWGGMWYAFVDASSIGIPLENKNCLKLVDAGMKIRAAVRAKIKPMHPHKPGMTEVAATCITGPLREEGGLKIARNTVILEPGRCDRSPCGTGTSARLAIFHARGQIKAGEIFTNQSIIGTEFKGYIRGTEKVGDYDAVLPTISGRAWITSYKQIVLDPTDPYPQGFRVGDIWAMEGEETNSV